MKTERMVLLVNPAEKARIGAEAAKLGVSASEYVRKLVNMIDAEDVAVLEEVSAMLPVLSAAVDSMQANIGKALASVAEADKLRAHMRSDEYRAQIREEVLADPTIDWDAVRSLFGPSSSGGIAA